MKIFMLETNFRREHLEPYKPKRKKRRNHKKQVSVKSQRTLFNKNANFLNSLKFKFIAFAELLMMGNDQ